MISAEEGRQEFQELEGRLRELHEKRLPAVMTSFFPLPPMMKCAEDEDAILSRMKELKRECPGIVGNVPAFGMVRMMLGIEAGVQAERLERLRDEARREGFLTPEDEAGINEAVAAMRALRKREGIFLRFIRKLAEWRDKIYGEKNG